MVSEVQSNNEKLVNGSKTTTADKNVKNISNLNASQKQCPLPQGSSILGLKDTHLGSVEPREVNSTKRGQRSEQLSIERTEGSADQTG